MIKQQIIIVLWHFFASMFFLACSYFAWEHGSIFSRSMAVIAVLAALWHGTEAEQKNRVIIKKLERDLL